MITALLWCAGFVSIVGLLWLASVIVDFLVDPRRDN